VSYAEAPAVSLPDHALFALASKGELETVGDPLPTENCEQLDVAL
jgi:hypothetical protein